MNRLRLPAPLACAGLVLALAGCERGCLSTWLAERGAGAGDPSAPRSGTPAFGGARPTGSGGRPPGVSPADLGGTDCSDGLARCSGTQVEISVAGHIPYPCTAPKELPYACACRWEPFGACLSGECLKDGLEVVSTPDVARIQLCRAPHVVVRPLTPVEAAAVPICAEEGVSCVDGIVRVCLARGQPARLRGACVFGCAIGISLDQGDLQPGDGAVAILCLHAHAERR